MNESLSIHHLKLLQDTIILQQEILKSMQSALEEKDEMLEKSFAMCRRATELADEAFKKKS